jgi:hypothetical protein
MAVTKRYIFLDIDGVCNYEDWYYQNRVVEKNYKCGDCDPKVVELLNSLEDLGAEVVISSSWGESADKMLEDVGLRLPIVGHTEHFYQDWLCRGNEIEKWIQDHCEGIGTKYGNGWLYNDNMEFYSHPSKVDYDYVILDDDSDMLLGQAENFIHVNGKHGLTQEHIDKAREILTRHA